MCRSISQPELALAILGEPPCGLDAMECREFGEPPWPRPAGWYASRRAMGSRVAAHPASTRRSAVALLIACLFFAPPAILHGQNAPAVAPGVVVRLSSPAFAGVATIVSARPDSMQIVVEGLGAPLLVPNASITSLERRRGATALERLGRGAVWGGGIGAVLGLAMAAPGIEGDDAPSIPEFIAFMGGGGAMWGAMIGLAIPQSRWDRLPVPDRAGFARRGDARGVAFSYSF